MHRSYVEIKSSSPPESAIKFQNSDGTEYFVEVKKSKHKKCVRCWHLREDVGYDHQHLELCSRCVSNLPDGPGEERQYA